MGPGTLRGTAFLLSRAVVAALLSASTAAPQPALFTPVTSVALPSELPVGSLAFGDYDNDGWPDLFAVEGFTRGERLWLLQSQGDGSWPAGGPHRGVRFVDRTPAIHESLRPRVRGAGAFGDYDGDGDLDLFVGTGNIFADVAGADVLLRNDLGVFREVTREAGLSDSLPSASVVWWDHDRDGHLDLYVGHWVYGEAPALRNGLYRNLGDGTFADVTSKAGLDGALSAGGGSIVGTVAADFDGDGWPDLYVATFQSPNRLFRNDTLGGFEDATSAEIADPGEAYGVAVGDVDNDGNLDLFQPSGAGVVPGQRSLLLLNLGQGVFLDATAASGLEGKTGDETRGAGLADVDNDGDLDLLTASPRMLFLNQGGAIFTDATEASGLATGGSSTKLAVGDYDLDGFLDVWFDGSLGASHLFRNSGNHNHYLRVELAGRLSNRNGIGARIVAVAGDLVQTRQILGGRGWEQDEPVAHFGLGARTRVDRLEVHWPSGQLDVVEDLAVDRKVRIVEGRTGAHDVQPTRWSADSLVVGSPAMWRAVAHHHPFEKGAVITAAVADLSALSGPPELDLEADADGAFRMSIPYAGEGTNGLQPVTVRFEQATSLGPRWTTLSRQVFVFPQGDLVLFAEGLADGWSIDPGLVTVDPQAEEGAFRGRTALAFRTPSQRALDVRFHPDEPTPAFGYAALRFAWRPGEGAKLGGIRIAVNGATPVALLDVDPVDPNEEPPPGAWREVLIPLDRLRVPLGGHIEEVRFTGRLQGTLYLDEVRVVASQPAPVTAVVEATGSGEPHAFLLEQNHPNPFNHNTVIRFVLPEPAHVDLALYDLLGQRVTTLARGQRLAGAHHLRWDGTDRHGLPVGSGTYVYRLTAGDRAETRKLLLLR